MLTDLWFRVRALARRDALEDELDEELREHLAHETRKHVDSGLSFSAAARRARLAMGGLDGVKEQCRDARGTRPLEDFVTDLRYGLRLLTRSPGFAAAAIAMLGLGVGSATAIFGIVESVLLRPLPYPDSERIVTMAEVDEDGPPAPGLAAGFPRLGGPGEEPRGHRRTARGQHDGGDEGPVAANLCGPLSRRRVARVRNRHGARPADHADESRSGWAPVAVVSHGFAQSVGADARRAVGEAIEIAGASFTIVGVLAPAWTSAPTCWFPPPRSDPMSSSRTDYNWERRGAASCRDGAGCRPQRDADDRREAARRAWQQGVGCRCLVAARRHRPRCATGVAVAAGRGRPVDPDRVRERREPAAGAGRRPTPRDRRPPGARRRPRARGASARRRKPAAGAPQRRGRDRAGPVELHWPGRDGALRHPAAGGDRRSGRRR